MWVIITITTVKKQHEPFGALKLYAWSAILSGTDIISEGFPPFGEL
jgi:hypothetical protein